MTDQTTVPAPAQRLALARVAPEFHRNLIALDRLARAGLGDPVIAHLVDLRASQINGCAFCLDIHSQDARENGEAEHRLHTLSAWRETPFFTPRERAALALTEAITLVATTHVPDEVFDEAAKHFSETELAHLIGVITTINALNRVGVSTRMSPTAR
ncbi:carboxymuconolactone decarboxylase family protein [Kitasatospora sp. NPDC051984]|uniref:carboxymuconolactone decarboxylase family protein n=1 Tax=Kitasatospora sp. NPDC051984 TaxID=3364059 RepID=UPI0037C8AC1B